MFTRFCRKWKAGVHPGAHVGVTLILWLANLVVGIMAAILTQYNNCDYYSLSDDYDSDCEPVSSSMNATTALLIIAAVAEFVVFVVACAETHRRNTYARNVYMTVPPFLPPGTENQTSFEQFQAQQYRQFLQYQQQQRHQYGGGEKMPMQSPMQPPMQQQQQQNHQVREYYSPGTAV